MTRTEYKSIQEVLDIMKRTEGHQFKEYDINKRLENPNNKGLLGHIVEEGILGYSINSDPHADIPELNLEVKATGVIEAKKKNDIKAKERLTLDSINYMKIVNKPFEESDVWLKCQKMLLVFYQYLNDVPYGDMRIIKSAVNEFSLTDIAILKRDYDLILSKIKAGKAEEISEGDTMYLGACTAGKGELKTQPFSTIKAKQRKFCIKVSYFTELTRKYVNKEEFEHVLSLNKIIENTFEIAMHSELDKYRGWSETKIRNYFKLNIKEDARNRYERYMAAMLGVRGDVKDTEEFVKANMEMKTIRVQKDGTIEQCMSFPCFDFKDIASQDWEESDFRNLFESKKFMLAIFKEKEEVMCFDRIMFWNMPTNVIDTELRKVFEKLKSVLLSGNIVNKIVPDKNGKEIWYNNFPGMADSEIAHVRPHGRNKADTNPLPVPDKITGVIKYTKQCFWLNNSYVKKIIKETSDK